MYIYERKGWPNFSWDQKIILSQLTSVHQKQWLFFGKVANLGFEFRKATTLETLTQDVIETSEIEGEKLDLQQVRSSVGRRLGIRTHQKSKIDKSVEGIVEVLIDATQHFEKPFTQKRLFNWHKTLFQNNQNIPLRIGKWRSKESEPMTVVSGPIGRETIHFRAPSYKTLKYEMRNFLLWFNKNDHLDFLIKSAIAHFWFVTLHPFADGNGRIARAIGDMVIAKGENSKQRFYSISKQINQDKNNYYDVLETCQKRSLDISFWITWYLNCVARAIEHAETTLQNILTKSHFLQGCSQYFLNSRQLLIINKLLEDFYGNLTSSKWAKITKCSQDTALRDINDLLQKKILKKDVSGGRSTHYLINMEFVKNHSLR